MTHPASSTRVDQLGRQARALLAPRPSAGRNQQPETEPSAPWVMVTGGKGGVGKTVLSVNIALQLASRGKRTLLVDLDPGLGNVDVHLRLAHRWNIEDLADGLCTGRDAIVRGPGGIDVLTGRSGSTRLTGGDPDAIAQVLEAVGAMATNYDVVVCDSGAGIGPLVLATARRSQAVLAVTTPDPSSLTDTYALCKVLDQQGLPLPALVLNQVESKEQGYSHATKLRTVAKRFLAAEPVFAGGVRAERAIARSAIEQKPFSLTGSGEALADLQALTSAVVALLGTPTVGVTAPEAGNMLLRRTHGKRGPTAQYAT